MRACRHLSSCLRVCGTANSCIAVKPHVPYVCRLPVILRARISGARFLGCRKCQARKQRVTRHTLPLTVTQSTIEADVAVVGGGIIGLWVALQLLHHPAQPSVALVERELPCSGATGAGITRPMTEARLAIIMQLSDSQHKTCISTP